MTLANRVAWCATVLILLVFGFTAFNYLRRVAATNSAQLAGAAMVYQEQIEARDKDMERLRQELAKTKADNADLSITVAHLRASRPPVPAPRPVPTGTQGAASELSTALGPVAVGPGPQALSLTSAQLVLKWKANSDIFPDMERQHEHDEKLLAASDRLVEGLRKENAEHGALLASADERSALVLKKHTAEIGSLNYTVKELKAENRGLRLKIVVAVPLAAYVGYRLSHH